MRSGLIATSLVGLAMAMGGGGDDTINVRDGDGLDTVRCGLGTDRVEADRGDKVDDRCEGRPARST